ncbi:murein L,D-transpeptidase catalytic domain family protein [Enterovibrio sp. ZSDZ35]|uniref:Murein L,D-transpeptidase catalytic domain family protein n=1 Tax=Enterovibrio qingdaonensis TaxID=2899818 RepID=A0ABT5QJY2_9GAMM|nr:murein L,D-transpeptidase catalytic domain family protein [Enterovibrio sp. ZSDZ35]MDD1780780.1 murein L,D-transpeptidase catalytic domain family protein [Enterovibrio sp. ZSDZ35]
MFKAFKAIIALVLLCISSMAFAADLPNAHAMYRELGLTHQLEYNKFAEAYNHFKSHPTKKPIFTLIDYGKPSSQKRFWVIDAHKGKVLYSSYVSHGKNSGSLYATKFSNRISSHKTSVGVFRAAETYYGKHGYSLRLDGLSKGVNDNARKRAIVIHGASYANPKVISKTGQLGRSWGCPALPTYLSKKVINTIKDGTYIYAFA